MRLGRYIGLQQNFEILCLSFFGIVCTIFDASLLDFNSNIYKIWEIKMDPDKFSDRIELYMKYLLTIVVLIRTFTVHIYLVCYIVLLYPVYFKEKAVLLLPWISINAIKCLFTGFISAMAGVYTCSVYKFMNPTCWEFMLTQFLEHAPSVYMFQLVLEYYRHLKSQQLLHEYINRDAKQRRRNTRDVTGRDSSDGRPFESHSIEDNRKLISVSTIENVILHFTTNANRGTSRSMDTLLDHMKSEEERQEMFPSVEDAMVDDNSLSIKDRTARMLELTKKDIDMAVKERDERLFQGKKANKSMTSLASSPIFEKGVKDSDVCSIQSEHEVRNVFPDALSSYETCNFEEDAPIKNVGVGFDYKNSPSYTEMRERDEKQEEKRDEPKLQYRGPMTTLQKLEDPSTTTSLSKMEGSLPFKDKASFASGYRDDGYTQALLDSMYNCKKPSSKDYKQLEEK